MGYQPSLDGIRAVAVVAVLLYHADVRWLPGRVPRRRRVLRRQRLPHHVTAGRGTAGVDDDGPQAVLAAARQAAAACAVRHAGRDLRLRRGRGAGRALPPAHRRPRRLHVLDQLVAHREQAELLRGAGPAAAAAPPVVARGRGAVVPAVAAGVRAGDGARARANRAPGGADPARRPRIDGVDGDRLRPVGRRVPRLLRNGHSCVGPADRRRRGDGLDAVAVALGRRGAGWPASTRSAGWRCCRSSS